MGHNPQLASHKRHPRQSDVEATPSQRLHDPHEPGEHAEDEYVHVVPVSLLATVLGGLLILTIMTVGVTLWDFGYEGNLTVALVIAAAKGGLVGLYFMHLRWDSPFNVMALFTALLFLTVFIGVSLMDSGQYAHRIEPPTDAQVSSAAP